MHGFILTRTSDSGRKEYLRLARTDEPRQFVLDQGRASCFRTEDEAKTVASGFINSRWVVEVLGSDDPRVTTEFLQKLVDLVDEEC
jgi:hypothetical protein